MFYYNVIMSTQLWIIQTFDYINVYILHIISIKKRELFHYKKEIRKRKIRHKREKQNRRNKLKNRLNYREQSDGYQRAGG